MTLFHKQCGRNRIWSIEFDIIKFMITCVTTAEVHYSLIAMTTTSLQATAEQEMGG